MGKRVQQVHRMATTDPGRPRNESNPVKPEPIDLSMYETSYCVGWGALWARLRLFAQPRHSHRLVHLHRPIGISTGSTTCGIYYNAPIWVASQEGVDTKLGHPKALDTLMEVSQDHPALDLAWGREPCSSGGRSPEPLRTADAHALEASRQAMPPAQGCCCGRPSGRRRREGSPGSGRCRG